MSFTWWEIKDKFSWDVILIHGWRLGLCGWESISGVPSMNDSDVL